MTHQEIVFDHGGEDMDKTRIAQVIAGLALVAGGAACGISSHPTPTHTTPPPVHTTAPTRPTPSISPTPSTAPTTHPTPPPISLARQNAARDAQNYLDMQGFSRTGLIKQLSSSFGDGYTVKDATAAVDSLHVDWNEQAVKAAKGYLALQSFSRNGLIQQLESSAGDGFTHAQAVYGATKAGL